MRKVTTAAEVIDALGGTLATARLIPASAQAVSNWRRTGRLPSHTFLVLRKVLAAKGHDVPSSVWGIREPLQEAAE